MTSNKFPPPSMSVNALDIFCTALTTDEPADFNIPNNPCITPTKPWAVSELEKLFLIEFPKSFALSAPFRNRSEILSKEFSNIFPSRTDVRRFIRYSPNELAISRMSPLYPVKPDNAFKPRLPTDLNASTPISSTENSPLKVVFILSAASSLTFKVSENFLNLTVKP